jgi:TonB family protein
LLVPIGAADEVRGILRLWSDSSDGFREEEIALLEPALNQALDSWKLVQDHSGIEFRGDEDLGSGTPLGSSDTPPERYESEPEFVFRVDEADGGKLKHFLSAVLFLGVIGLAIILGVAIGWHGGREQRDAASTTNAVGAMPIAVAKDSFSDVEQRASSAGRETTASASPSEVPGKAVPAGGLVITENGKVVYQSGSQTGVSAIATPAGEKGSPIIHQVAPIYPPEAIAQRVEGPVVLDVKVRADGTVRDVLVVSGEPLLTEAAVEAVRQWRFRPNPGNVGAMENQTRITVRFSLPAQ